ncbi:cytochrome c-type biogenesis protein CcmF [Salinibacter ruber]|uniref:heme lyase CcmF/NrfE family subunit n=1 Tax=Salinibacter ruber TaxID=146919 RepID=UPI002169F66B|nr:cytochrome c biogenesis protein CcsA [Salinibacter ruber]MCS4193668.1 cytochrome c-type biogenesis protein CcmF [Salinibacter ruber]
MLGTIGELLLLSAFVACGVSAVAFFWAARTDEDVRTASTWKRAGRWAWGTMSTAVGAASGVLWYMILSHQYQYAYVYQQSSNDLPGHYLFSTFWAGQEGSFLFWALMMCVVGGLLIAYVQREYETPVMAVVGLCQLFLLSMIVGLQFGPVEIGSSPFMTLPEKFADAPIFQKNPGFVPADGQGLNDLLQNPWMTIHPPILFLGFSAMVVPFAFALAALWKKRYTQWVRPALPWTLFAVMALGVAIAMGGYWAYVTLSFGGYWAWDPVENSSLVPWLLGVAAFHTMLVQKKSGSSQKASLLLSIAAYLFVIYSTFLTRSGILGDVSVHSFVSLGLYNQLLLWIATLGVLGIGLFTYRYGELPVPDEEPRTLSREFMILCGAVLLTATAAVIILGTSAPIFGQIFRDNPSAVPQSFYNQWTLPLALGFVFLAGLGQLFWWKKMDVATVNRVLLKPLALATASTIAVLILTPFAEQALVIPAGTGAAPQTASASLTGSLADFWAAYGQALQMLLLLFVGFFSLFGNGAVLWRILRGNPRMAGGALSHVGFALIILGIIASNGFDQALPRIGEPTAADEDKMPRENFVVAKGQTRVVNGYRVTYEGKTTTDRGRGQYILDMRDPQGRTHTFTPVAYQGSNDQWFKHPDVKAFLEKDLFVAVTPKEATGVAQDDGPPGGEFQLANGDSTTLGDREYAVAFHGFEVLKGPEGAMETTATDARVPDDAQMAVGARLRVTNLDTRETRSLMPIYLVMNDNSQQYIENRIADWDLRMSFTEMDANNGEATFAVEGVDVMPENWVVVQAYTKPLISVLWGGIIILTIGFVVSIGRRVQDIRFRR